MTVSLHRRPIANDITAPTTKRGPLRPTTSIPRLGPPHSHTHQGLPGFLSCVRGLHGWLAPKFGQRPFCGLAQTTEN